MARPTKTARLQSIHEQALAEFDRAQAACRDERMLALSDRRFVSIPGAMWEGALKEQFANKPMFEINKVMLSLIRIYNEYRNNRITVNFVSKDGEENTKLAETCNGLYRADEQDSCAQEAYDNAFEEAVAGGFGAWRLRACYEDEEDDENEKQRIRIEPIFDADSCVFFDPDAKRQDKADAKWCIVLSSMTREAYAEEYGDDPATWPHEISQAQFDWSTPELVFIAEYYRVEEKREIIRIFSTVTGEEERYTDADFERDPELAAMLDAVGTVEVRTKTAKRRKVRKYILSGGKVLEDCGFIAGKHIPIIPVYGKRWFIDGVERFMGHVRLAKDAVRLKNMQLSKLAEISASSSVSKPIMHPEEVAGHQLMWSDDNIQDYPYLLRNPLEDREGNPVYGAPIQYTQPPQIPPAMAALLQLTETDLAEILGNNQQADKVVSNISGKAVEMIQQRLDMQSFIYMSNMSKAMQRCGEVWLSMGKELHVEEGRKMKTVDHMEQVGSTILMRPVIGEDGEQEYENDMSEADFDVAVDVGPSFMSRRDATVRALTGMMQVTSDPQDIKVLSAAAMMNMEGEGLSDIREYYRKQLVNMGVVKPTDEEAMQMQQAAQNAQPDAQQAYLMAEAQKSTALSEKAAADTELTRAKTVETLAGIDMDQRRAAIETAQAIASAMQSRMPAAQAMNAVPPAAQTGEMMG